MHGSGGDVVHAGSLEAERVRGRHQMVGRRHGGDRHLIKLGRGVESSKRRWLEIKEILRREGLGLIQERCRDGLLYKSRDGLDPKAIQNENQFKRSSQ